MIRKATQLITDAFDAHEVIYRVTEVADASIVEAGFEIKAGPDVVVRFISNSEDNDVAIRAYGLLHKIPAGKRSAMLEACNTLSSRMRYLKFILDADSDVSAQMDLPLQTGDDCVGECCFEMFVRFMSILEEEYHVLAEALYSAPAEQEDARGEILRILRELREKPLVQNAGRE